MKTLEHTEQVNLMRWWALTCHKWGLDERLLFAIPNGGERNIVVASRLKAEGVRAGVPDLFLACGQSSYHGLFIELKKPKGGRVSEAQKSFIELLKERGYATAICHGWSEARSAIESYLAA